MNEAWKSITLLFNAGLNAFIPLIEEQAKRRKKPVGKSWRMDKTYIKVKGEWCYLYRAVDKEGNTIDFLLCKHRDTEATKHFFKKAIENNGVPLKINIDKSGANAVALEQINQERRIAGKEPIEVRRIKYLNNPIEQGPPLYQANDTTDAWFQIVHLCWDHAGWD